jgi:copper resistance protein D
MDGGGDFLAILGVGLKFALYLTSLLASGFALAIGSGVIERETSRDWLKAAIWLALVTCGIAALRLCLSALQLGDMSLLAMVWDMQKRSVLALVLGLITLTVARFTPPQLLRAFTIIGAIALCASFAVTGHTQALESPALFSVLVAGHATIASFWMAAPLVLWPHHNVSDSGPLARVERFGTIAMICVPLLFIGGGVLAWRLGGGFQGLTASTYGQLLGAKLLCATTALALGALNKLRVARLLETRIEQGRRELKRTLTLDGVLFLLALLAVALATTLFGPPSM